MMHQPDPAPPVGPAAPPDTYLIQGAPGTGKTMAVIERVRLLLKSGERPRDIHVVTFSERQVVDLRWRLESYHDYESLSSQVSIGTFATLAAKVLEVLGQLPKRPRTEQEFVRAMVEPAVNKLDFLRPTELELAEIASRSFIYHSIIDMPAQKQVARWADLERAGLEGGGIEGSTHEAGLVAHAFEILERNEELVGILSPHFTHLLVDEFQETTQVQFWLLCSLAGAAKSLLVAGDPNQRLFGWRGAMPDALEDFKIEFPGCTTRILENDFRSTRMLVVASDELRSGGQMPALREQVRIPQGDAPEGSEMVLSTSPGGFDHTARDLARLLPMFSSRLQNGWNDVAVLTRRRSTVDSVLHALRVADIPYAVLDDPPAAREGDGNEARVSIGSIHASKGLEWQAVCILDVSDQNMPGNIPPSATGRLEEEQRNFYVALTRAKSFVCFLTPSESNTGDGAVPSRFLASIPDQVKPGKIPGSQSVEHNPSST